MYGEYRPCRFISVRLAAVRLFVLCAALACLRCGFAVDAQLQSKIEDAISSSPARTVAVYLIDGATSHVLANLHGEEPVQPASNNKLFTTAAGLSLLGEDFQFHTRLFYQGKVTTGKTLDGDLVILGGGDPTISGRFAPNKRDVTHILREWVATIKQTFTSIRGDVIADDSYFEEATFHPTWSPSERAEWYEAEVSALAFNDNCIDLNWSSKGKLPGDPADMLLSPVTKYVDVINQVKVAAKGRSVERYYKREANSNTITAVGTVAYDSTRDDSAAVHNGALYLATVFKEVCTSEGLSIKGKVLHRRGEATKGLHLLVDNLSPKLSDVVKVINLNSQNFYAECLCKTLGRERRESGSWAAGTEVTQKLVRDSGVFHDGQKMVDGCGLSSQNRTTARELAEIVRLMDTGPHHDAWRASLPIGGTRGSLKSRFQQTSESRKLAPLIYGKTGLIGGVRSLSGIIDRNGRPPLYYSIVLNGLDEKRSEQGMALIDRLALLIADLP